MMHVLAESRLGEGSGFSEKALRSDASTRDDRRVMIGGKS